MLYQWFKEGDQLKDATNNELSLAKVQPINEGLYICRVANIRGYQFSRWIRIVVEKRKEFETDGDKKPNVETVENIEPDVVEPIEAPEVDDEGGITKSGKVLNRQSQL